MLPTNGILVFLAKGALRGTNGVKLKERVIRKQKNETLANRAGGAEHTCIALVLREVILTESLHSIPHFFLGYEDAILSMF